MSETEWRGRLEDYDPMPGLIARGIVSDEHDTDSCEADCCAPAPAGDSGGERG